MLRLASAPIALDPVGVQIRIAPITLDIDALPSTGDWLARFCPHSKWTRPQLPCGYERQSLPLTLSPVTNAVGSPVSPATLGIRVVSRASARDGAAKIVVRRRASINLPAPGGRTGADYGQNACIHFIFKREHEN